MSLRTDLPDAEPSHNRETDVFLIKNGINDDWADEAELSGLVALYEMDGLPFTVQRFPGGGPNET